jgi:hypothetical protein
MNNNVRYIVLAIMSEQPSGFHFNISGSGQYNNGQGGFNGNATPDNSYGSPKALVAPADRNPSAGLLVMSLSELRFDGFVGTCVMCGHASVTMDESKPSA